jgi:UDP-hydrolysing UDP-N-acetyl-D-glucosamine 2-epimerase
MGENPRYVFNIGSPDVEFASLVNKKLDIQLINNSGVGTQIDINKPFLIAMQHPVTTEKDNRQKMEMLLRVIDELNIQTIWFWPNNDAGTNEMAKVIRVYREEGKLKNNKIKFITHLLPEDFIALLKRTSVLVGNSSAGIKECSYLGIPVVNIGTRQQNRLRGLNVLDVGYNSIDIKKAIQRQLSHGPYPKSDVYYKANTSKKMVDILSKIKLYTQKNFYNA